MYNGSDQGPKCSLSTSIIWQPGGNPGSISTNCKVEECEFLFRENHPKGCESFDFYDHSLANDTENGFQGVN